uniref:NTR domain-containing protein n=1 Tax=Acrobeloides nanus TaxID=290746 RepID=A0A914CC63_9BILA
MANFSLFNLIFVSFIGISLGCKCIPPTQNMAYCRAQWISKANILKQVDANGTIIYNVQHLKIFKNITKDIPNEIYTANSTAACGVTSLLEKNEYLLVGIINSGKLYINSCIVMPILDGRFQSHPLWRDVPQDLRLRLVKKDFKPCPIFKR